MAYLGESAALATAACWTVSATAHSAAAKRIGSLALNVIRLPLALALFCLWNWFWRKQIFPFDASTHHWLWLSISGIVGFTICDLFLLRAYTEVGPRMSMLVMTLAPPTAAILAWAVLGESVPWYSLFGILITIAGVIWVVLEEPAPQISTSDPAQKTPHRTRGLILAFIASIAQGVGFVLSKIGMQTYDPFAATQIRVIAGTVGFILLATFIGWWPHVARGLRNTEGLRFSAVGAFFGPFLGVSLSLLAIQNINTGIASTLMAIVPILLIPVAFYQGERITWRAGLGAVIAVAGVALLVFRTRTP